MLLYVYILSKIKINKSLYLHFPCLQQRPSSLVARALPNHHRLEPRRALHCADEARESGPTPAEAGQPEPCRSGLTPL